MFVVQLVTQFQTVGHVDIMLPGDVESHLLVEFPFEADTEGDIGSCAETALPDTDRTGTDA